MSLTPRHLALDFVTALELSPRELVDQAVKNGCGTISVLVQDTPFLPFFPPSQLGTNSPARRDLRSKCQDCGVTIDVTEVFIITPEVDLSSFEPAFESAAYLGARAVNTLAFDPDHSRLQDSYAKCHALARGHGLSLTAEVIRSSPLNSLKAAADFFGPLGLDVKVELDALHFYRYGGTIEEIHYYESWIGRAQLCDGPPQATDAEYQMEALFYRQIPGFGALRLVDFLAALPHDVTIGVEVPNSSYRTDERIKLAFAQARRLIEQADAPARARGGLDAAPTSSL